jgi:hypothetical protein
VKLPGELFDKMTADFEGNFHIAKLIRKELGWGRASFTLKLKRGACLSYSVPYKRIIIYV